VEIVLLLSEVETTVERGATGTEEFAKVLDVEIVLLLSEVEVTGGEALWLL
jgi:hypothetical protein